MLKDSLSRNYRRGDSLLSATHRTELLEWGDVDQPIEMPRLKDKDDRQGRGIFPDNS
jgi:hypothetical protein